MIKRFMLRLLVAMLLLVSISVVVTAQDEVVIDWWHISTNEPEAVYWQGLADAYVAEHPNVTINITILENDNFKTQLVTVMQANDPPDLFHSWGGGVLWEFANAGLVRDIAPELEGEWRDSFAAQSALELYGQNGEYYGVPWDWGAVGIFYNMALFEEAGLDPDNPPETWTEFLETVQILKDAGITPIAFGEAEKWPGHFWWMYVVLRVAGYDAFVDAYNRSTSFADEPFLEATEYLQQLIDLEPFPEGFLALSYPDQAAIMGNGEAAMELMGQWSPNVQAGSADNGVGIGDDLSWFPFPVIEGGAGDPDDAMGGGGGFVVGANAPDETIDFLRYLTSVEAQEGAAQFYLPVVHGLDDLYLDNPINAAIVETRDNAPHFQLYLDQFLPPAMGQAANDAIEGLFSTNLTPEEVVNTIEEAATFELE